MTNERGWKGGVYNPGFGPDKAYIERKAREFREAGIEFPEIKGVRFRQMKPLPMRHPVTRVVMVGFDPFNQSGLPEHIERQVIDDYFFWYNDYAMRQEFKRIDDWMAEERPKRFHPTITPMFEAGLISQREYDQVMFTRGHLGDVDSNIFSKPISELAVVPPDEMVPMFGGVPMVQTGIDYTKHHVGKHRFFAPGSIDRLKHYEESALDRTIKGGEFLPKVTAYAVGEDGVKRDLRDIDFMSIVLGTKRSPIEGQLVDKGVEVRVIPDDEIYESPPHVSKLGDGYKLDHIAALPPATGAKPLFQQFVELTKQTSQGRGRDETTAIYHAYHMGLEALEESILESRAAGKSLLPKPDLTAGEVGDASAELAKIRRRQQMPEGYNKHEDERGHNEALGLFTRRNPLREHWEKHGDPYEGRLPPGSVDPEVLKEILDQNHNPELLAQVKARIRDGLGDLESTCDEGLPPVEPTPEEIADQEAAMQEAAEGKLDYLLEGTQWDPKLRK